jgi:hypothetical protein
MGFGMATSLTEINELHGDTIKAILRIHGASGFIGSASTGPSRQYRRVSSSICSSTETCVIAPR